MLESNNIVLQSWELLKMGGVVMIPLGLCSILSLSIIMERIGYLSSLRFDVSAFKNQLFKHLQANESKEAILLCDQYALPIVKVLRAGVMKYGCSRQEIEDHMKQAALAQMVLLEGRLGMLSTIINLAPMLGLFGTILGIAKLFNVIAFKNASMQPVTLSDFSSAMGQSMLSTIAGLFISIVSYIAYRYFVLKISAYVNQIERESNDFVLLSSEVSTEDTEL